jgi:N-acetylglutamate synthase-like GNAT family acetyltransferase
MNGRRSDVAIRPLVNSDIGPILGFWWSSFIANKDMVASQIGGRRDLSLIGEFEGHLVGFILARIEYLGIPIKEVCLIHALAVEPEYQRQGIGSLLINKLKSTCDSKGILTIRAFVSQDDSKLLSYFERLGFNRSDMINLELRSEVKAQSRQRSEKV